jgi:CO/xanthine dehydrogenase Mo-binding subunit
MTRTSAIPASLAMAPVIANAIDDAVGGQVALLPITTEKVLQTLRK